MSQDPQHVQGAAMDVDDELAALEAEIAAGDEGAADEADPATQPASLDVPPAVEPPAATAAEDAGTGMQQPQTAGEATEREASPAAATAAAAKPAAPAVPAMKRKGLTVAKAASVPSCGGAPGTKATAVPAAPVPAAAPATAVGAADPPAMASTDAGAAADAASAGATAEGPAPGGTEGASEQAQSADTPMEAVSEQCGTACNGPSAAPAASPATAPAANKRDLAVPKAKQLTAATVDAGPCAAAKPAAGKGAASSASAPPADKLPRPRNAYQFLCEELRPKLKGEGLSVPEMGSRMGAAWKALDDAGKAPYLAMAAKDKEEVAAKLAAMGPDMINAIKEAGKAKRAATKDKKASGAGAGSTPSGATASTAGGGGGSKKRGKASTATTANTETTTAVTSPATAAGDEEADSPPVKAPSKRARKAQGGRSKSRGGASRGTAAGRDDEDDDGGDDTMAGAAGVAGDQDSDDSDREDVEWGAHPAAGIFAAVGGPRPRYLVRRRGVDLTQYGAVDARAAKRLRLGDAAAAEGGEGEPRQLPVELADLEDWEEFENRFWREVHDHTQGDSLDLEDLPDGSLLEAVYVLGKLRERHHILDVSELHKRKGPRKDFRIQLPALHLSLVVQRMLCMERAGAAREAARADRAEAEAAELRAQLAAARAAAV